MAGDGAAVARSKRGGSARALPDLAGHEHAPTAFLVYVILWTALDRGEQKRVALSLQRLSEQTDLSKSAVQNAVWVLKRRGLIKVFKTRPAAVFSEHSYYCPAIVIHEFLFERSGHVATPGTKYQRI